MQTQTLLLYALTLAVYAVPLGLTAWAFTRHPEQVEEEGPLARWMMRRFGVLRGFTLLYLGVAAFLAGATALIGDLALWSMLPVVALNALNDLVQVWRLRKLLKKTNA